MDFDLNSNSGTPREDLDEEEMTLQPANIDIPGTSMPGAAAIPPASSSKGISDHIMKQEEAARIKKAKRMEARQ